MGRIKLHNFESSNEILLIERFKHSSRIFHRRNVISLAIKYYKITVLLPKHHVERCRANYNNFKVSIVDRSIFSVFILRYYLAGIEFFLERLWQKINYVTAISHHGTCYLTLKWTIWQHSYIFYYSRHIILVARCFRTYFRNTENNVMKYQLCCLSISFFRILRVEIF